MIFHVVANRDSCRCAWFLHPVTGAGDDVYANKPLTSRVMSRTMVCESMRPGAYARDWPACMTKAGDLFDHAMA